MKISFLIAAHNEEKIIAKTLENLKNLPYPDYEVIIGLDACTDNTEKIVKKYAEDKKFRYYNLNLRQGKTFVINQIIKHAKGKIIVINDADWLFNYNSKENLLKFFSVFNNKKIGGIAEHFPVEWDAKKIRDSDLGYKMVAYSSYYWFKYQKEMFSRKNKKDSLIYLKEPTMSLTNIFRKKLYKQNLTLGDDFERTAHIMNSGYNVVLFDDIGMPRMTAVYSSIKIKDLIKQKIRNAIARKQISAVTKKSINASNYYFPAIFYMLKKSFANSLGAGLIVLSWVILTSYAAFIAKFMRKSTSEGWKLRAR